MAQKIATLAEVAHAAKVSLMTASRAINQRPGVAEKTRENILRVAARLGYVANRAAQKLSGGQSHVIGVIATDLENPFIGALMAGTSEAAWEAGYETLIYSQIDREKRPSGSVMQLLRQISDGVIAILPLEFGYLDELAAIHIPIVTIDHRGEHADFPSIATDSYAGARSAIEHLIALGHQKIAYLSGDERLASARERRHAYTETLLRHGLPIDSSFIATGDFTQQRGFTATSELLTRPQPPTAIFAANDLSALGAIAAIREAGLAVPADISVIGFDDIPAAAQSYPALTTIRQPLHPIGHAAVRTLCMLISGERPASPQITLPTEFILRASTGAPPKTSQANAD